MPDIFDALADPNRRRMLDELAQRESATPTELAAELPVTRQAVSKHLQALADAGLVESERRGRETHYRLNPAPLHEVTSWVSRVGGEWDERLAALRRHLRPKRS
jgi:DNA-binding transcriptional ArsR family regulator